VEDAIANFKTTFFEEPALLDYFSTHWEKKKGTLYAHSIF
jgi:hypothetical protein